MFPKSRRSHTILECRPGAGMIRINPASGTDLTSPRHAMQDGFIRVRPTMPLR